MKASPKISAEQEIQDKRNQWFEEFIHHVTTDKDFLKMGLASDDTKQFYDKLIFGGTTSMMSEMRQKSTEYFIGKLVFDYLKEINAAKATPEKLLVDYNDSQILVWAEVREDDEVTERALFKAEAKANAKNYAHGFYISSTILETSDQVPPPPHYQNILTK
jgi:hypothetical protein